MPMPMHAMGTSVSLSVEPRVECRADGGPADGDARDAIAMTRSSHVRPAHTCSCSV